MLKKSLVLFAALLISSQSLAMVPALVPNCWDNPDAVPRAYILGVNRARLGSAKALHALKAISQTRYLHAKSYPMFFDNLIVVDIDVPLGAWGDAGGPLTEAELRVAAEGELITLARQFALSVECNGYVYPQ